MDTSSLSDAACDFCEVRIENQTGQHVAVSYYATGGRRPLGAVSSFSTETFEVIRPLARSGVTVVVEVDGRDSCRGVIDLPGKLVVGNSMSCKPDRPRIGTP